MEWLITHSWSILLVLIVGAVLGYYGVFEISARPRFEGLDSSGIQPVPDNVVMYSDGIMVLTVMNTRPYRFRLEWIDVAPIVDKEDVIRTTINEILGQGEIGVYEMNATNLLPHVMESGIVQIPAVDGKTQSVDFVICMSMTIFAGGTERNQIDCGEGHRISYISDPHDDGSGGGGGEFPDTCNDPLGVCPCEDESDCPLDCRVACIDGYCSDWCNTSPGEPCGALPDPLCSYCACVPTIANPNGECKLFWHSGC